MEGFAKFSFSKQGKSCQLQEPVIVLEVQMRLLLLSLFLSVIQTASTFSQEEMQDVIYLENGSVVRGAIVELVSNVSVKIKLQDGIVYVYPMDEVRKIVRKQAPKERKSPELAFVLSLIFPGAGQYYNGDVEKGLIQDGILLSGIILLAKGSSTYSTKDYNTEETIGLLMIFGASLWSLIDAPISASKKNKRRRSSYYGHLFEFEKNKNVIGIDLGYFGNSFGSKVTYHF